MQFNKSLIGITFALCTLTAGATQAEWKYNTEVFFAASDDASVSGIRWLQPWWQSGKALVYSDLRVLKSDKETEEVNIGGGFRRLNEQETGIWGGYAFFDYRRSASDRTHTQVSLGGEYLLDKWEFRSNIYLPLKDEFIVGELDDVTTFEDSFTGSTLTRVTTVVPGELIVEESLQGYDLEAGYLLPGAEDFEIRANLGIYQYSASVVGSTQGLRGRIEAFPRENFKVSVSIESDDLFGTRSFLELSLPLGKKIGRPGKRSLHKRMTQFAHRDIDVRETSRIDEDKRTRNGPRATTTQQSTEAENILHIDSQTSVAAADANGTIELPFNSIEACVSSANTLNCGNDTQEKIIYLHADPSATRNGNAQTYIGNLELTNGQSIAGDGATTGVFASISSKESPILLGADGNTNPILTLSQASSASGLQLGWSQIETIPGTTSSQFIDLPTGSAIPDEAIRVINENNRGANVQLSDITIIGAGALNGDNSRINTDNNFSTGIHFLTDSTISTENSLIIDNLNARLVLGDAIYAELISDNSLTPATEISNTQTLTIIDSTVSSNGRGIHASVFGESGNSGNQAITVSTRNSSAGIDADTLTNTIEFNLNEGILVENLTLDTYENALQLNLADSLANPLPFLAKQDLRVTNAFIQGNQGAGIQTAYGAAAINSSDDEDASSVSLQNVNLSLNEGSGLVLSGLSTNMQVDIEDSVFRGNVENSLSTGFGQRQDGAAIDCGTGTSTGSIGVAACNITGPNVRNENRTDASFRKQGYGIFAENRDVSNSLSTQTITISGNFESILHAENQAQIFLESIDLNESNSLQTLNILDDSPSNPGDPDFIKLISTIPGQSTFTSDGEPTVGPVAGSSIEPIAFCNSSSGDAATATDEESPNINFSTAALAFSPSENCP